MHITVSMFNLFTRSKRLQQVKRYKNNEENFFVVQGADWVPRKGGEKQQGNKNAASAIISRQHMGRCAWEAYELMETGVPRRKRGSLRRSLRADPVSNLPPVKVNLIVLLFVPAVRRVGAETAATDISEAIVPSAVVTVGFVIPHVSVIVAVVPVRVAAG